MIIGMMGAGAVGCYYGAMLAQAGHDVTVIARQHHIEAIGVTARFVQNHMLSQNIIRSKAFKSIRLWKASTRTAESGYFAFKTLFQNASQR